jgi:GGDEF domain-containing protein
VAEARTTLLPDEIVLALVRRLARAFDLAACAFVATGPGERGASWRKSGVARTGTSSISALSRDPRGGAHPAGRHDERPGPVPTLVLPVGEPDGPAVLLLRAHDGRPPLAAAQLALATGLGEAAARALANPGRGDGVAALERRLHEEFERARRYSLSFLVLVAVDALEAALGRVDDEAGGRLVADVAAELRRTLRLPDFVSRYAGEGFAIVLPETDLARARRSVGRLRNGWRRCRSSPTAAARGSAWAS